MVLAGTNVVQTIGLCEISSSNNGGWGLWNVPEILNILPRDLLYNSPSRFSNFHIFLSSETSFFYELLSSINHVNSLSRLTLALPQRHPNFHTIFLYSHDKFFMTCYLYEIITILSLVSLISMTFFHISNEVFISFFFHEILIIVSRAISIPFCLVSKSNFFGLISSRSLSYSLSRFTSPLSSTFHSFSWQFLISKTIFLRLAFFAIVLYSVSFYFCSQHFMNFCTIFRFPCQDFMTCYRHEIMIVLSRVWLYFFPERFTNF